MARVAWCTRSSVRAHLARQRAPVHRAWWRDVVVWRWLRPHARLSIRRGCARLAPGGAGGMLRRVRGPIHCSRTPATSTSTCRTR
jgi:hypothetical protein